MEYFKENSAKLRTEKLDFLLKTDDEYERVYAALMCCESGYRLKEARDIIESAMDSQNGKACFLARFRGKCYLDKSFPEISEIFLDYCEIAKNLRKNLDFKVFLQFVKDFIIGMDDKKLKHLTGFGLRTTFYFMWNLLGAVIACEKNIYKEKVAPVLKRLSDGSEEAEIHKFIDDLFGYYSLDN